MSETCPWCGAKAVDVTIPGDEFDRRHRYICCGPVCHEWLDGEGPEPVQEPLIIIATR